MNKRIKSKKAKMFISELEEFNNEIKHNTKKLIVNNDPYMDQLALIFDKYHYSYKPDDYDTKDIYYFFESYEFLEFGEQYFIAYESAVNNPFDDDLLDELEELEEFKKDNNDGHYIGCNMYGQWFIAIVADLSLLTDYLIYDTRNKLQGAL